MELQQFIRLQAGTPLPHEEGQSPTLFVLQGVAEDSGGTSYRPGDILQLRADDHAEITAAPGPDLICLYTPFARPGAPAAARPTATLRPAPEPATRRASAVASRA